MKKPMVGAEIFLTTPLKEEILTLSLKEEILTTLKNGKTFTFVASSGARYAIGIK